MVAYGMVGASLSGITFMSVPGWVGSTGFSYMMVVLGYVVGYFIITKFLLPLYYKLNLTSIYGYLNQRFGFSSYKTGAFFFLLSRTIGASFRMFLVVKVLQVFVFSQWGIPFYVTTAVFMVLMVIYTIKGGIKTIVWTDTLQTTFMLISLIVSIVLITGYMDFNILDTIENISKSDYSKIFYTQWQDSRFFVKQFISGIFITIVMTGLDQDMMQKNLSCRTLKDSQKNMRWLSIMLVFVNFVFLSLGVLLFLFAEGKGIELPKSTDDLFPMISFQYLGAFAGIVFLLGLVSAAYSSADSALTSLTTSFCIDFLGFERKNRPEARTVKIRYRVHILIAGFLFLIMVFFSSLNNDAIIEELFTVAGYTYGPLLGLFAFGMFTRFKIRDKFAPVVCVLSPVICYFLSSNSKVLFGGYTFGFELLILNGIITFAGLLILKKKHHHNS